MKRIMTTMALCGALLAGACGDDLEQDEAALDTDTAGVPVLTSPGLPAAPDTTTTGMPTVTATLTEWDVQLSSQEIASGPVTFEIVNAGTMHHAFEIEGSGQEWETEHIEPGGRVTMSANLPPGEYKVYCPIADDAGNHEERGMVTQLRVR